MNDFKPKWDTKVFFLIKNPGYCISVQKYLFKLGYKWSGGGQIISHTSTLILIVYPTGEVYYSPRCKTPELALKYTNGGKLIYLSNRKYNTKKLCIKSVK